MKIGDLHNVAAVAATVTALERAAYAAEVRASALRADAKTAAAQAAELKEHALTLRVVLAALIRQENPENQNQEQ